jgi:hypothetical protein
MSVLEWIAVYALVVMTLGLLVGHIFKWRQGPMCWCGHRADAHWHYRPGTECSDCDECSKFRAVHPHG